MEGTVNSVAFLKKKKKLLCQDCCWWNLSTRGILGLALEVLMRTSSFPFSHTGNEEVELEDGYGSSSSKGKKKKKT